MSYTFHVPTKVLFGPGALKRLHDEQLPGKKALLVISNTLARSKECSLLSFIVNSKLLV